MDHDVFVSYAHANKAVADAVCATLEQAGIRCWIAPRDVQPGADWTAALMSAISTSRVVVLVFSSDANQSAQVRREMQAAFDHEIIVIPVRVEEVTPSSSLEYYLGSVHWLDAMTPPLQEHLSRLAETISRLIASPRPPAPRLEPGRRKAVTPWYRRWLWPAIGLLALIVVAAYFFPPGHSVDRAAAPVSGPLEPAVVMSSATINRSPQISPDGTRIAFMSNRSGALELWTCDPDGSNPVQLTDFRNALVGSPRWSFEGSQIVFDARINGKADIWVVSASGGTPRQLTKAPSEEVRPSWSRDGQWVYYGSDATDKRWEIWKVPSQGGVAVQVTTEGGREAFEAPDGQSVFYTRLESEGIWKRPVRGNGPEVQVAKIGRQGLWAVASSGLIILRTGNGPVRDFEVFPLAAGERERVITVKVPGGEAFGLPIGGMEIREVNASRNLDTIVFAAGQDARSVIFRVPLR